MSRNQWDSRDKGGESLNTQTPRVYATDMIINSVYKII